MTLEAWVWCLAVTRELGYCIWPSYDDGLERSEDVILGGTKKTERQYIFRTAAPVRPGFVRILPIGWRGLAGRHGPGQRYEDFDLADPSSVAKAAAFARGTFGKAQREEWQKHCAGRAGEPSGAPERAS